MPDGAITLDGVSHGAAVIQTGVLPLGCEDVVVTRAGRALLDHIDLVVEGSGLSVFMGPNGAGKSLLLRVLANLTPPDSGRVWWGVGRPDRARATHIGIVFQRPALLRRSVIENVKYALAAGGVERRVRTERALELLATASLTDFARAPARVLSGGEQQRLALVRALANDPQVLLLDEPTSSLDPAATLAIEQLIGSARARGTRVVLVTHDVGQAKRLADEVVFMHHGRIVERTDATRFFERPESDAARAFIAGELVL